MSAPTPERIPEFVLRRGMVRVPAGMFLFGACRVETALAEFWVDRHPVTNAEYARVVPEHRFVPSRARHPVTWVSWEAARRYLGSMGLELPTREQWEKAARGTDGRLYPWGDDHDPRRFNILESDIGETTAVDRYEALGASPFGVVDMAGNVWEWTLSELGREAASSKLVCGAAYDLSWFEMQSGMATCDVRDPSHGYATVGFRGVWNP